MNNEQGEILLEETTPALETPALETPAPEVPVAPVELRYEYQPSDEQGRPIGAKQVIKYTRPEELAEKLAEQNTLLIRKLRSETRKNRLGITDTEEIPAEAQRYQEPITFNPRELSPDERVQLSRNLLDPEKFDEARDLLFESAMGANPEKLRTVLNNLQVKDLRETAKQESNAFMAANPQYVKCQENFEAITNWMIRYDLAPVRENFQKAYEKLRADGVLIENYSEPSTASEPVASTSTEPVAAIPTPVAPVAPATPVVASVEQPSNTPSLIPTGLSRSSSEEVGASRSTGDDIVYEVVIGKEKRRYTGLAAINAMPSEEFARRVNRERGFSQKVEKLEAEAAEKRRSGHR